MLIMISDFSMEEAEKLAVSIALNIYLFIFISGLISKVTASVAPP